MFSQPSPALTANVPANAQVMAWDLDDDLAIGCECANPALQIERWDQEHDAVAPGEAC